MSVTILDFHADWCGPCSTQDPILEELMEKVSDVTLEKVDVDENQQRANDYSVRSIPTIVVLDNEGEVVDRFVGVTQEETILDAIEVAKS
jgi:thioredoxin 1